MVSRYGVVVVPPSLSPGLLCQAASALGLQELVTKVKQESRGGLAGGAGGAAWARQGGETVQGVAQVKCWWTG